MWIGTGIEMVIEIGTDPEAIDRLKEVLAEKDPKIEKDRDRETGNLEDHHHQTQHQPNSGSRGTTQ